MAGRETPAVRAAKAAGIAFTLHEYAHDPRAESYGLEAVEALGLDAGAGVQDARGRRRRDADDCVVPAAGQLDLGALGKRAAMAPVPRAEKVTGYVAGGISPLGQRRALPTVVDDSALEHATVFVSAGRRGLEIELAPADLVALTRAQVRRLRR